MREKKDAKRNLLGMTLEWLGHILRTKLNISVTRRNNYN